MAGSSINEKVIASEQYPFILVEFSNGYLKLGETTGLNYSSYRNKDKESSNVPKRLLIAKSNRLSYIGTNFQSHLENISSTVLKVCVVNKKDYSVNFYDADLFHMKPFIKCSKSKQKEVEEKSFIERSSDLTLEFGSKVKKKMLSTKMRYGSEAVNSDSIAANLALGSEALQQEKNLDPPADSNMTSIIPPQNSSAASVEKVYNLYDIISAEEYAILDAEAEIFFSAKMEDINLWKNENRFSDFIIQYMQNNIYSMNLHKAKLLCYIHYMFCFLKTVYADWRKKDPVPGVPEPFRKKLMDSFTIKKSMPQRMKDKLLAYTIVAGLLLNNFILNGSVFATSAKISLKRMESIAYVLGCHVSSSKGDDKKIIQLKLPLYKYQPLPKRKRK